MSLLTLLAAGTGPVVNTTFDGPHSATLRPAWDHVVNVGPTRTHTTVAAGVAHARTMPFATSGAAPSGQSLGIAARGGRPVHARTLVLLDPGTYDLTAINDMGDGIDLMGNGNTRADVVVRTTGEARYALRFWGSMYAANLTLRHDAQATGNNYPMHGSTTSGTRDFTAVLDNVAFYENNALASNIAGWDMPPGMRAYLYRCHFDSHDGNGTIVFHDMHGSDAEVYYIECAADKPMNLSLGTYGTSVGKYVRIGCTTLDGTPLPDVVSVNGGPATAYSDGLPALPSAAITATEEAKYLPLATTGTLISPSYGTTATATPVDDRTYYIPLGALSQAALVKALRLSVVDAGTGVSLNLYVGTDERPNTPMNWNAYKTTTGAVEFWNAGANGGIFMERDQRFWVGVRCKGGAQVACSTTVPGVLYEDGGTDWNGAKLWPAATLTPVTAASPVPAAVVVAQ